MRRVRITIEYPLDDRDLGQEINNWRDGEINVYALLESFGEDKQLVLKFEEVD